MTAEEFAAVLADPDRLRSLSAVVLGADTPAAVGTATGLSDGVVRKALRKLTASGLVGSAGGLACGRTCSGS